MKKVIVIISIILISAYGIYELSKLRSFQIFGGLVSRANTEEKIVALTFDDAPLEKSSEVLKVLADKNVKATFYSIGMSLEKYPEQAKEIVEQGHELGNHSYSHQRFIFKSQSFIKWELEKTNSLIREAGYVGEITFRPPYGKKLFGLPYYLKKNNIKTVMWDLEPDTDYAGDAHGILKYTLENTRPGSIILLHPLCGNDCNADREALPKIIDGLREKGFSFVTIAELLKK